MKRAADYTGPVWITSGEHRHRLAFLDSYQRNDVGEFGVLYLEGEWPGRGASILVSVDEFELPPLEQVASLEQRLWFAAMLKR